jgi:hypothetical protein
MATTRPVGETSFDFAAFFSNNAASSSWEKHFLRDQKIT